MMVIIIIKGTTSTIQNEYYRQYATRQFKSAQFCALSVSSRA